MIENTQNRYSHPFSQLTHCIHIYVNTLTLLVSISGGSYALVCLGLHKINK